MILYRKVWETAERQVAKHHRKHVGRLRQFLRESENPHARALSGRKTESDPDESSVRKLEVAIIDRCKGSRSELSGWLSLCYAAISEYNRQGGELPANDLAPFLAPPTSPFAPEAIQLGHAVPMWREKLHDWISGGGNIIDTPSYAISPRYKQKHLVTEQLLKIRRSQP